uniref:Uncharacterized protein n=1 Tax=Magallana gigas TaxID=29159 RepID=A0A8W8MSY0_MAGGI
MKCRSTSRCRQWLLDRRQTLDVPDEITQTPDAHVQSTGGETARTQSSPSDSGKIPVHISDTQLRHLAEAILVGIDRGATPLSSTEPDLTFGENAGAATGAWVQDRSEDQIAEEGRWKSKCLHRFKK